MSRAAPSALILALLVALSPTARAQEAGGAEPEPGTPDKRAGDSLPPASEATGSRLVMPPIRWWGSVTYDARKEHGGDQAESTSQALLTQINASTFLWAPYIAQVSGGLGLVSSLSGALDRNRSDAVTGNLRLIALPMSRFPFEAWVEHADSRSGTTLIQDHYTTTRLGLTQRYSNVARDLNVLASYDRSSVQRDDGRDDVFHALQLDLNLPRGIHDYQVNGRITRNESSDGVGDNSFESLFGKHAWRPDDRTSVESLATLSHVGSGAGLLDSRFFQLSSLGIWRPNDLWLLSGSARVFDLSSDSGNLESAVRAFSASAGASYLWRPQTRLNASLNVNRNDSGGVATLTSDQTVGITHQPEPIAWGKSSYQWGTSASVSNRTGGDTRGRRVTGQIGHSLERNFNIFTASVLSLNAQQNLNATSDSDQDSETRISHGAGVTWNMGGDLGSAYVRLSVNDARTVSGPKDIFQLANLQASLNSTSGARSSWNGNLTLQATRQLTDADPDNDFDISASGDLSYQHSRFMRIPRLRFLSQIRLSDNRFVQQNSGQLQPISRNQETRSWENRLDYVIGRTNLSLALRWAEIESEAQYLLQLQLTRSFGDL